MSQEFLFICGFPSSGTDLLRNILNAHPDISVGGEFLLLPTLTKEFGPVVAPEDIESAQAAIRRVDLYNNLKCANATVPSDRPIAFSELFARMLVPDRIQWVGSKTPQNTENMDQLLQLFPDGKFVIVIRDVRDVALSWRKKWGKNMFMCARKWNSRMGKSIDTTSQLSSSQYIYVLYENILGQLEQEATRICEFLGVSFDKRMLTFQDYVHENVPGKINFGKAIVEGNKGKWVADLSHGELQKIEQIAWPTMKKFGYIPEVASAPAPISRFDILRGTLQDILAVITVGNRSLQDRRLRYRWTALRVLARKLIAQTFGRIR